MGRTAVFRTVVFERFEAVVVVTGTPAVTDDCVVVRLVLLPGARLLLADEDCLSTIADWLEFEVPAWVEFCELELVVVVEPMGGASLLLWV